MNPNKPDILCFSSTDWEELWGSRQQIMLRFARRGHRVLFIERPVGLEHLLRYPAFRQRKLRRWREGIRQADPNVPLWIVSLPVLLPGRYYTPLINSINQRITVYQSRSYLRQLGIDSPILWLYNPEQGPLIGQFNEQLSIYHCIDEWTANTKGRKRYTIAALEIELLRQVDLVFANSPPTYQNKRRINARTYRIPSGVDHAHFAQALDKNLPIHPAIAKIPPPRIGYSGTINERLNYSVLEFIAQQRPDWSLVFIGDPYPWTLSAPPLRRLQAFPNVNFIGKYPFSAMPALLKGIDVCLLPYVDDERGYYRSPLKLYEYLAVGKPIVSMEHPEASEFVPHVYLASTPEEFLQGVACGLTQDSPQQQQERIAIAQQNSWDSRVEQMDGIIQQTKGLY